MKSIRTESETSPRASSRRVAVRRPAPRGKVYAPKKYEHLIGLEGFSEPLLRNHFTLYEGYVTNTNTLAERIRALARAGKPGPEYSELKRRFGWEWNGVRLHELYFENLTRTPEPPSGEVAGFLKGEFGTLDAWERDFKAAGAMRGIGWVVTYYDLEGERLFNAWIDQHDGGHLAGCRPAVVLDVYEHAYMPDYGVKKDGYLDAFFAHVDWKAAAGRLAAE